MKALPAHPVLYQVNTRVWLTELSRALGRPATLDDVSDAELDRLAGTGFDWVWFLSVWRTGPAAQQVSRTQPDWRQEFEETLPDLHEEDMRARGSRSPATRCTPISAAMRRWRGCASDCGSAVSG